jgi:hypothetical protein
MELSGQLHAPAALLPESTALVTGWASEPVWTRWRIQKISQPLPRIETRSSSPQPSHYTDRTILPPLAIRKEYFDRTQCYVDSTAHVMSPAALEFHLITFSVRSTQSHVWDIVKRVMRISWRETHFRSRFKITIVFILILISTRYWKPVKSVSFPLFLNVSYGKHKGWREIKMRSWR